MLCTLAIYAMSRFGDKQGHRIPLKDHSDFSALYTSLGCDQCEMVWNESYKPSFLLYTVSVFKNDGSGWASTCKNTLVHYKQYSRRSKVALLIVKESLGVEPHWTKVMMLSRILRSQASFLHQLQHVMFVDSDVVFQPCAPAPQAALLHRLPASASMLITSHYSDYWDTQKHCSARSYSGDAAIIRQAGLLSKDVDKWLWKCSPNTGAFVVKNGRVGLAISKSWAAAANESNWGVPGVWKCDNGGYLNDQGGFNAIVAPTYLPRGHIALVEGNLMNGRGGCYLKHFLGYAKADKIRLMDELLAQKCRT